MRRLFDAGGHTWSASIGLLLLRLATGGFMAYQHGYGKWLLWSRPGAVGFADPLGVGPKVSLALAIFGELVCGALILLGLGTRVAALPAAITMGVAAFVVHGDDLFGEGELALLYLTGYLVLIATGAGRLSMDAIIRRNG